MLFGCLRLRGESGVTLLELMVAVAVLGILAAIAVPYYGDYIQRQRLIGAAEAIYGQMQLAKRAAISNNTTVNFLVQGAGSSNWCATYSEDLSVSSDCSDGWVTSSSANQSMRIISENFPSVSLTELSSGASTIGFVMPGVSVRGPGTIEISTGSSTLGNLRVSAQDGMSISICSTANLGRYEDC